MADGDIDTSDMPHPADIGLIPAAPAAAADPTDDMPGPVDLWRKYHFGSMDMSKDQPGPGTMWNPTKDQLDAFMANPPEAPSLRRGLSALSGLPKVAAVVNPVTPVVAGVAGGLGALSGAGAAIADLGLGHPERMSEDLAEGDRRLRSWSGAVYSGAEKLADYLPHTARGDKTAADVLGLPGKIAGGLNDNYVRPWAGDAAADTLADVGQDIGTVLPALGAKGLAVDTVRGATKVAQAAKKAYATEAATLTPQHAAPATPVTSDVGEPVSAESLRAAPNPIPPPEGTPAYAKQQPAAAPPVTPAAAETGDATVAAPTPNAAPAPSPALASASLPIETPLLGQTAAGADERGSVRIFNAPKDEGPQENPQPEQQNERAAHIEALDKLSGGKLPSVRQSALTGDYNATGDDWQLAKVGSKTMQQQLANENDALHAAMDNIHKSTGSLSNDSVDPATLEERGRTTRGAIQAIEQHFSDATDAIYDAARASNQGRPIAKLQRVSDYLNDDSNFANDAEIGLQRAAKQRLERLWSTGDPDKGAPPGSVNAAERLREFLNEKGKNPAAMGVANELKGHLDMDVAEHGGPGLFEAARAMRRHKFQMLEEPTGIKKLLTPGDSAGINHAIPEHKVMDYIADLPREQHEHVMNVLRAGAHLSPEIAEQSAAAIREIQAHTVSRLHDAATNDGGKWNARDFYNASARYARNAASTFKDRPDILQNLKTVNDAGNVLHLDKSYPGAAGQTERTGTVGHLLETGGKIGASLAHEIPVLGRFVGGKVEEGVTGLGQRIEDSARERAVAKRLVDRSGRMRGSVRVMNEPTEDRPGSMLNVGLHQGQENQPGFRKMSKQEATGAVESTGAKVTKSSVLTPEQHGVYEPTLVASTNRPLSEPEMQSVLAKTKQSAIPQRTDAGVESMHIAPGHEEIAKQEGWDKFNPEYFRDHDGSIRSPGDKQRGSVRVMSEKPLAGAPEGDKPNGKARAVAAAYKRSAGIDTPPLKEYRYVDPAVAKNVADAYEAMKHDPTDPKVAKSYAAFKAETLAQYKAMEKAGVKVDLDPSYPYKNPREMHEDVRQNNHMSVYPTEAGFGSDGATASDHPLMEKAPVKIGGKDATYNDLFRAVHDYYGHAAEGNGFRANGEYNAWRAHRQMYSPEARGAMDAETLGQNSWVNSGPAGWANKGASQADTIYADQKAGLLPKNVVKSAEDGVSANEHHITNQLTPQERAQLRSDTTQRLIDAFHGTPATQEYAAAALAGAAKRGWYRSSAQAIVNAFGHEAPRFAGLLSAMSPQVSVATNFANALKTYINWDKAGRPEDPSAIRKIMEDSSQRSAKNTGSSNVMDAWVNNAVRALTADDPNDIKLSGPKVHSFYNNLTNNVHEVTNDAWMSAFAKVNPAKLAGSLNNTGPGKSPTYLALSGKVREAARMLSHLTGETWTPAEVQETVWSWAKTAYEHAEEKGDRSIPDLVKNGDITDDLIRSTPDFHQLFSTSEHRGLLQSSRFAGNAERVADEQKQSPDAAGTSQARQAAQAALRPHLISAAERLERLRQERKSSGAGAPKEE